LARPGDKIPVDGTLTEAAVLDESMISGAPIGCCKVGKEKDLCRRHQTRKAVSGSLRRKVGARHRAAQIIQMVQEAAGRKGTNAAAGG